MAIMLRSALTLATAAASMQLSAAPLPPPPPPGSEPRDFAPPYHYLNEPSGMAFPPIPRRPYERNERAPNGDPLGDVWEMQEVAGWSGVWIRRGKTSLFDAYWTNPGGERIRAPIEMWSSGRRVTVVRRHSEGRYCRYDGLISPDWVRVEGHYTCTWERTPMPWSAQIVRMDVVTPHNLRPRK